MTAKKDKDEAVHTSAPAPQNAKTAKPAHHQATTLPPPDAFHGKAGRYVRDPDTGLRVPQD